MHTLFFLIDTQVMLPKGREMVDAEHVQTKYNITHPGQMRDLQALMGDSAVSVAFFIIVTVSLVADFYSFLPKGEKSSSVSFP